MRQSVRVAAALLFMSASFAGCDSERYRAEEKFGTARKNLMASAGELTQVPAKTELSEQPSVKGKVAVFQKSALKSGPVGGGAYNMDIFYFRGLEDLYATTSEEVGTVALLNCKTTQKGTYKTADGKEYPADAEDCELTLIDRSKQAVVFKKMFEKTPSDDYKVVGNTILRQSAHQDILPFLKGLPRT